MQFDLISALNAGADLAVAAVALVCFLAWYYKKASCRIGKLIGISGFLYLSLAVAGFMWVLGYTEPLVYESLAIRTIFLVLQTVVIMLIVYELTQDKKLLYLFGLYAITIATLHFTMSEFLLFVSGISLILTLLMFLDLALFTNFYLKAAGLIGVLYCYLYLVSLIQIRLGMPAYQLFWFVPDVMMLAVYILFFMDIRLCGLIRIERQKKGEISYPLLFMRYLVYVTSITAFLLLSVIAMHELGHALTAQLYGCQHSKAVIYEVLGPPHTEVRCLAAPNYTVLGLAGLITTTIVGLLFLLTNDRSLKRIAYLILGFGLFLAYGDMKGIGLPLTIIAIAVFTSLFVIIIGLVLVTSGYLREHLLRCNANRAKGGKR